MISHHISVRRLAQIQLPVRMIDFGAFLRDQIAYYVLHVKNKRVLLDQNGDPRGEINLSFSSLSDQYLTFADQQLPPEQQEESLKPASLESLSLKITDADMTELWQHLDSSYPLWLNLEGQDIGDETMLKLSELYLAQKCAFSTLRLAGNSRITGVGVGKLGSSLQNFPHIKEINLHGLQIEASGLNRIIELINLGALTNLDLGLVANSSLEYLGELLERDHRVEAISLGENQSAKWTQGAKRRVQQCVRRAQSCKNILSVSVYGECLVEHYEMISELNIICHKNRGLKLEFRENEFKAASLNPAHPHYYEPDNHSLNAYKFSVKSYLNNVFGSLLDEALYFLEKERRNSLREEEIFKITQEPINKIILEDICTADGSIVVLTKYLLNKIKEQKEAP